MLKMQGQISCLPQSIGFDMDYTLSQYRPETFEVLAYNLTIDKLVKNFHYPQVCLWCKLHISTGQNQT